MKEYPAPISGQPSLPGVKVNNNNRIKLTRINGGWAARRFGLEKDKSKEVREKYGGSKIQPADFVVYHLHTIGMETPASQKLVDQVLSFLEENNLPYEVL